MHDFLEKTKFKWSYDIWNDVSKSNLDKLVWNNEDITIIHKRIYYKEIGFEFKA